MSAAVHILVGPAGSGKTRRLAERFRHITAAAAGTALWLGPTFRAVEKLRPGLCAGRPGGLDVHLLCFQDFVDEVVRANDPAARPLAQAQRRLVAEEVLGELHARGKLSHFSGVIDTRGFADTVFALLAELKQSEVLPAQLADVATSLARRGGTAEHLKEKQCALVYAEYQRRLVRHGLYDREGRFWYARDLLTRGDRHPFAAVRSIFVDGFCDFTRTECDILAALAGWARELWITLPGERGADRAELFTRPRAILDRLAHLDPHVETLDPGAAGRPAGLAHLERQLFRPVRSVACADDAEGIWCIEAPGAVGEARLVARRIKGLLHGGVPADEILVTLREVGPYADLVREVFAEYGIPLDVEGAEPLLRNPAVATLLRTVRLPEEDWPFAAVTALLRSGYFDPDWPEVRDCPEIPQHAEALLRLLGEPRGRDAYLRAMAHWAERVHPGLEDEQAEESRRRRKHDLAKKCQPFLRRFFAAWDEAPHRAPLEVHAAWLRRLADDLGLGRAASRNPRDAAALARFGEELERWVGLHRQMHDRARPMDQGQFLRTLFALAAEAGLARTPRGPGRVRVLSAELARHLEADYVFVMGLGERSFPRLAPPVPLFDEAERQALRHAGLDLPCADGLLADEMLLFYQVVTRARRGLVLSYPALDEKGQALLPSSFLNTLRECFVPGAIPVERRRMLIEGYDREPPLSAAEGRVRLAAHLAAFDSRSREPSGTFGSRSREPRGTRSAHPVPLGSRDLPADLAAHLAAAADMTRQRFLLREHTPYDGLFRDGAVIAAVQQRFGPERVFSPTALENYIACPFRFFLGHVLRLEPLEEPREEIEGTDRGLAFHRALSRLHNHLRDHGVHQPEELVDAEISRRLDEAVRECASRASPASEVLWGLEGQRLQKLARLYRPHWKKLIDPWLPRGVRPQPHLFEVSFGLPAGPSETAHNPLVIRAAGVEVRVSGRIDRVDLAELPDGAGHGFWIIDYKTGRSANYTGSDLQQFRRLQLTLYALAAEEVLLTAYKARPLGLAYWLVADSGPKLALPDSRKGLSWYDEVTAWPAVRDRLRAWVVQLVTAIRSGAFALKPREDKCTETCDFAQVCRISQVRALVENKTWQLPLPVVP